MSVQMVNVLVPPAVREPRGAVWIGYAVTAALAAVRGARKNLRSTLAARRAAGERRALLAMASRYRASQPEFAKDLYAAACNDRRG